MNRKQRRANAKAGTKAAHKRPGSSSVAPSVAAPMAANVAGDFQQAQALHQAGRLAEAEALYRRVLESDPGNAPALHFLGVVACQTGNLDAAEQLIGQAIARRPDDADAHNNLAGVYLDRGKMAKAKAVLRRAIELDPTMAEAHSNLGKVFKDEGKLGDAIGCYEHAIKLMPNYAEAHNNLGTALKEKGDIAAAEAAFRRAIKFRPNYASAHSNLIFLLDFDPDQDQLSLQAERRRWHQAHAQPQAARIRPHGNDPDPERALRIGYVSADFRDHSAAQAFGPVVLGHDPDQFEVTCYSSVKFADDVTARFRAGVDHWRDVGKLSDGDLAQQVRADNIDILVDLSGHTDGNRLLTFAEKPAPVQITAWGHCTGTGLQAIDYVFSDRVLVPPSERDFFAEEVFDLPSNFLYQPPDALPPVAALPAKALGHVTFGCLNRREKISAQAIELWAGIVKDVAGARLLIKARELSEDGVRMELVDAFAAHGIGGDRLELLGHTSRLEHLAAHDLVDIALDTFPQGGGISTADALWMGVPVVTFPGRSISARIAASILTAAGCEDFIAETAEGYRDIAVAAAGDIVRLAGLRAGLRQRAERSPLGDAKAYVRAVEAAYREMWRRKCADQGIGADGHDASRATG